MHIFGGVIIRRKWSQQAKFKSWTRLFAFYFVLMPLRKTQIFLFSLPTMSKIIRQIGMFSFDKATGLEEGKS